MLRWTISGYLGRLVLAFLIGLALPVAAQHGGHGGGMGGSMRGGPGPGFGGRGPDGFSRSSIPPPRNAPDSAGTVSVMRGGLQLGPPGRWWDDKHFAKDLQLRPDQQRRMDAIFEANRTNLLSRLGAVQQEQGRLETMVHGKSVDEVALNAQIDKVWQSLAELEKAKTHYLLQIRGEMDPDQLSKLEEHR